jgi:hypothetical protein
VRHLLVLANETVAGERLLDTLKHRARDGVELVTVICPVTRPSEGYVVYEDTRRASAGRRLDRSLKALREAGIPAHGLVVDAEPADAIRDALAQLEPRPTEIVVSTHPEQKSGWLRKSALEKIERAAEGLPVEHIVVDLDAESGPANVLVVANETVLGKPLLDRIRERAARSPASFLLVCPQSDPTVSAHPDAERRLRRALAELRGAGIDAHGQIAHPDPFTATVQAAREERTDEILISTFEGENASSWLRGNLVDRVRKETGLPVDHVTVRHEEVGAARVS